MSDHILAVLIGILQFWTITALGVTCLVLGLLAFQGAIDRVRFLMLRRKHPRTAHHTI